MASSRSVTQVACTYLVALRVWNTYETSCVKYGRKVDADLQKKVQALIDESQITAFEGHLVRAYRLSLKRDKQSKDDAKENFVKWCAAFEVTEEDVLPQLIAQKNEVLAIST